MDRAFGGGLHKTFFRQCQFFLRRCQIALTDCCVKIFDHCLEMAFYSSVGGGFFCDYSNPFLCRFDICHFVTPLSIKYSLNKYNG